MFRKPSLENKAATIDPSLAELRTYLMQLHELITKDVNYAKKKEEIIKIQKKYNDLFETIEGLDLVKINAMDNLTKIAELIWKYFRVAIKLDPDVTNPFLQQFNKINLNNYFDENGVAQASFDIQKFVADINEKMSVKPRKEDEEKNARVLAFQIGNWANFKMEKNPSPAYVIVSGFAAVSILPIYQNTDLSWTEKLNRMIDNIAEFVIKHNNDKNKSNIMTLMQPLMKFIKSSPSLNEKFEEMRNKYLRAMNAPVLKIKESKLEEPIKKFFANLKEKVFHVFSQCCDGTEFIKLQGTINAIVNSSASSSEQLKMLILSIDSNLKQLSNESATRLNSNKAHMELMEELNNAKSFYVKEFPEPESEPKLTSRRYR